VLGAILNQRMRQKYRFAYVVCAAFSFASLLAVVPTAVHAQATVSVPDRTFEADLFQPAIGPRNFLTVDAPEVPGHKQLSFGLIFDFQRNAYNVYAVDGNSGTSLQNSHLIGTQYRTELQAAIGLLDQFQLGVALPLTLGLRGDQVDSLMGLATGETYSTAGLGDLRIEAKGQLKSFGADDQFVLAGLLGGTLPTAKSNSYLGNKGLTGRAKALASLQLGRVRLGGQIGVLLRDTTTSLDAKVGSALLYGGAGSVRIIKGVEVLAEVAGRSGLSEFSEFWWDQNPVEADVAARVSPMGMLAITGGLGMGFGKGIGAPKGRLFLGAVFSPDFRDADQDGVYDAEDRCPDQPEDRDGFKDKDGCPEPDNDADGIPDLTDKCPNDAEDFDQFEDADGCPELDNDKDGIPDLNDPCPNAAEDGKGKRTKDGCPSTAEDADGDAVNDTIDKCPDEPEDRDTFQDEDGCPDPDNDGDGIPDGFDNCPNDAEDADSFEDEDGCPDPDNDKDGFLDAADKCPDKAETMNGNQDEDGCPDAGAEIVKLTDDVIEVLERLSFGTRGGKNELKENAAHAVALVALVMKGHPDIAKLRIEVHADGVSKDETQKRAEMIRDLMVRKGIESARLVPVGAGGGGARVTFTITDKKGAKGSGISPPAAKPAAPDNNSGTSF
jgi:outer membrane protein OmpA-like peptidoglycan-associated protein